MNPIQLSKLPLIFHLVKVTKIDVNDNSQINSRYSIKSDFHQTHEVSPEIFYKPISKIC